MPQIIIPSRGGGGGGVPGIPVWTYTAGAIGDGLFTTDNSTITNTFTITLAGAAKGGIAYPTIFDSYIRDCVFFFTDSTGKSSAFRVTAIAVTANIQLTCTCAAGPGTTWSGDYQISFAPVGTAFGLDTTGWATNPDNGARDVALESTGSLSSMATAVDVAFPGFGSAVAVMCNRMKSYEASFRAHSIPRSAEPS